TWSLWNLLSRDFVLLVVISFAIAVPVSWISMNRWLSDYTYRVHISWWIFLGAGLLTIIIAMVTVSFQAIRAAFNNPSKSLRTD
ncbi:MAG TPA: ABC transporter permease, partial [Chitinophagaceae bacterium]